MNKFHAIQVSGNNAKLKPVLAVIVKQTYIIEKDGKCTLAEEQMPLVEEVGMYPHNNSLLEADLDLYVQKIYTDIVVKGSAKNYDNAPKFLAEIIAGKTRHTIAVQGNQKVYLDDRNKIQFSEIEKVEKVPLRYDFAYGGKDTEAEKQMQMPPADILISFPDIDLYADSPFRYPRNPEGKGYLVEKSRAMIEQLEIPNLQDPGHLLTPENILVGDYNRWIEMPIPYATDWVNPTWVPRIIYTALVEYPHPRAAGIKEIEKRWVASDLYEKKNPAKDFNYRFFNGGHYALQTPLDNLVRECTLINIHPVNKIFTIKLPDIKPKIWVDGRKGTLKGTIPVIHSIIIEPDENRLSIVWCGSAPALRPYFHEELKKMPFKVEW
ncbi:MAG: DUF2169 domain-containing protein [Ginsengibacter sp.]